MPSTTPHPPTRRPRSLAARRSLWAAAVAAAAAAVPAVGLCQTRPPAAPAVASAANPVARPAAATTAPAAAPAAVPLNELGLPGTLGQNMGLEELVDASEALGQRFGTAAQDVFRHPDAARSLAAWRLGLVHLEAAARLAPNDARFPLLRSDALFQLDRADEAAVALTAYLKINPDDEVARLRLIEHFASRMQADDAKLNYFNQLLGTPSVSDEIKSRVATWAAELLLERSFAQALAMTERAVQLDPLNIYARRLEYQFVLAKGGPDDRLRSALAQLRCNPAQPDVLTAIGKELAAVGLSREANIWYGRSLNVSLILNAPLDPKFLVEYASLLYVEGFPKQTETLLAMLMELEKRNEAKPSSQAMFLRLIARKAAGQVVAFDLDLDEAKKFFVARAFSIASEVAKRDHNAATRPADAGGAAATTRPAAATNPTSRPTFDFSSGFSSTGTGGGGATAAGGGAATEARPEGKLGPGDRLMPDTVARFQKPDADEYLKSEFIEACEDLAWFEIYFNRDERSATFWLDEGLAKLLPPTDPAIARLRGWLELLRKNDAEAMKLLWPIRKTDALAGMGVAELLSRGSWGGGGGGANGAPASRPAEYDPDVIVQRLLDEHPTGVTAALFAGHFKGRKLYARPRPGAEPLRGMVDKFPQDLLDVITRADRFYYPSGEPVKTPTRMGEPMLAKVSIKNASAHDLPIGPDGIIKPDLWIGCRVALDVDKDFPRAASARLSGPLVLRATRSMQQVVRIDGPPVTEVLRQRPSASVDTRVTVTTNPMVGKNNLPAPGPAGVRREFVRSVIRAGAQVSTEDQRKRLYKSVAEGLPADKMWAVDALAAQVEASKGVDVDPMVLAAAPDFREQVNRAQLDRAPQVAGWAALAAVRLAAVDGGGPAVLRQVEAMAKSPAWEIRLLAVVAGQYLEQADRIRVDKSLAADPYDLVRRAAEADAELAAFLPVAPKVAPPAVAPGSPAPATGPAIAPATSPADLGLPLPATRPATAPAGG